jgi:uncharacterized protein (TIGR03067 family)
MKQQALWLAGMAVLGVGIALGAARADTRADDAKKDADKLQGTWEFTAYELEGKENPNLKGALLTFDGDKFSVKMGDRVIMSGTVKVDAAKKPATIDAAVTDGDNKGATMLAIYEITGDTIKVCADAQGKKRPTEFKTAPETAQLMLVAKRVKK